MISQTIIVQDKFNQKSWVFFFPQNSYFCLLQKNKSCLHSSSHLRSFWGKGLHQLIWVVSTRTKVWPLKIPPQIPLHLAIIFNTALPPLLVTLPQSWLAATNFAYWDQQIHLNGAHVVQIHKLSRNGYLLTQNRHLLRYCHNLKPKNIKLQSFSTCLVPVTSFSTNFTKVIFTLRTAPSEHEGDATHCKSGEVLCNATHAPSPLTILVPVVTNAQDVRPSPVLHLSSPLWFFPNAMLLVQMLLCIRLCINLRIIKTLKVHYKTLSKSLIFRLLWDAASAYITGDN